MIGFNDFIRIGKIKNLSDRTIKYYECAFSYLTNHISEKTLCCSIDKETIYGFIEYLKKRNPNISPVTINTYVRGVRAIFYHLMELGYINKFKIELIQSTKKIKPTYTDDELNILLKKPNVKTCSFKEYRNWVIVNYLLATGNRARTVINVKICDIDFSSGLIKLSATKNKKQQLVPISNTLNIILTEYLKYRKGNPDEYLFCNMYGQQMTQDSLHNAILNYNRSRSITKTSIHLFRHTFAKKWILNGGDIFRLQKLLGHSSLDIVKEYVDMFSCDLMKDFNSFNPLESMNTNYRGNIIRM